MLYSFKLQNILLFATVFTTGCGNALYNELDRLCQKDSGLETYNEMQSLEGVLLEGNAADCDFYCRSFLLRNGVGFVEKKVNLETEHYVKLKGLENGVYEFYLSNGQGCAWVPDRETLQTIEYSEKISEEIKWDNLCVSATKITQSKASHKFELNKRRVFKNDDGVITKKELLVTEKNGEIVAVNRQYRAQYTPLMASRKCNDKYTFFFLEATKEILEQIK